MKRESVTFGDFEFAATPITMPPFYRPDGKCEIRMLVNLWILRDGIHSRAATFDLSSDEWHDLRDLASPAITIHGDIPPAIIELLKEHKVGRRMSIITDADEHFLTSAEAGQIASYIGQVLDMEREAGGTPDRAAADRCLDALARVTQGGKRKQLVRL